MYKMEYKDNGESHLLIVTFYVLILLDIFTFSTARIEGFSNVLPIVVPYITVDNAVSLPVWMAAVVFLFVIGAIKKKGQVPVDLIGIFFITRILLGVIQISWLWVSGQAETIRWGNYYLYVIELLMYFCTICFFSYNGVNKYIDMIKTISLIIAVETIWQCVRGILPQVSYLSTWYKACMNIPVGSSNTLGAMISPCFIAVLFEKPKNTFRRILLAILAIAVFLTKSRFSMASCLIGLTTYLFSDFKNMSTNQKRIRLLGILVLVSLSLYFIITHLTDIGIVLYGFSDYVNEGGIINRLSSGRVSIIGRYLDKILEHPLFGNGPNYDVSRTHNIIIDILYQNGIIGFLIFAIAIVKMVKRLKLLKEDRSQTKFMYYYILFSLIGSLGEISFFTGRVSDVLFIPALAFSSMMIFDNQEQA